LLPNLEAMPDLNCSTKETFYKAARGRDLLGARRPGNPSNGLGWGAAAGTMLNRVSTAPMISRRRWLGVSTLLGAVLAFGRTPSAAEERPIIQPDVRAPSDFMRRAFDLKRQAEITGDQPFGAAVVLDERIVGQAASAVTARRDPTAHAEMEAIRDAARRLGRGSLSGAVLYSSSRPCPMCEAAAYWAGIDRMVHGADLADAGAPRLSR